jgi:hypothetical protein
MNFSTLKLVNRLSPSTLSMLPQLSINGTTSEAHVCVQVPGNAAWQPSGILSQHEATMPSASTRSAVAQSDCAEVWAITHTASKMAASRRGDPSMSGVGDTRRREKLVTTVRLQAHPGLEQPRTVCNKS